MNMLGRRVLVGEGKEETGEWRWKQWRFIGEMCGSIIQKNKKRKTLNSVHHSLPPTTARCVQLPQLPLIRIPQRETVSFLEQWTEINPFSLKMLLSGTFIRETGKQTKGHVKKEVMKECLQIPEQKPSLSCRISNVCRKSTGTHWILYIGAVQY